MTCELGKHDNVRCELGKHDNVRCELGKHDNVRCELGKHDNVRCELGKHIYLYYKKQIKELEFFKPFAPLYFDCFESLTIK